MHDLSLLWGWQEGVMVFTGEVNCEVTVLIKGNGERELCLGVVSVMQEARVCGGDSSL